MMRLREIFDSDQAYEEFERLGGEHVLANMRQQQRNAEERQSADLGIVTMQLAIIELFRRRILSALDGTLPAWKRLELVTQWMNARRDIQHGTAEVLVSGEDEDRRTELVSKLAALGAKKFPKLAPDDRWQALMKSYDKDHDKALTTGELNALFEAADIGGWWRDQWVDGVMENVDANKDHKLSFAEISGIVAKAAKGAPVLKPNAPVPPIPKSAKSAATLSRREARTLARFFDMVASRVDLTNFSDANRALIEREAVLMTADPKPLTRTEARDLAILLMRSGAKTEPHLSPMSQADFALLEEESVKLAHVEVSMSEMPPPKKSASEIYAETAETYREAAKTWDMVSILVIGATLLWALDHDKKRGRRR
jgi:hypothetical protein